MKYTPSLRGVFLPKMLKAEYNQAFRSSLQFMGREEPVKPQPWEANQINQECETFYKTIVLQKRQNEGKSVSQQKAQAGVFFLH